MRRASTTAILALTLTAAGAANARKAPRRPAPPPPVVWYAEDRDVESRPNWSEQEWFKVQGNRFTLYVVESTGEVYDLPTRINHPDGFHEVVLGTPGKLVWLGGWADKTHTTLVLYLRTYVTDDQGKLYRRTPAPAFAKRFAKPAPRKRSAKDNC